MFFRDLLVRGRLRHQDGSGHRDISMTMIYTEVFEPPAGAMSIARPIGYEDALSAWTYWGLMSGYTVRRAVFDGK